MNNPNFFTVIPSHVLDDDRIDDSTAILFGRIQSLTYNTGYCYASDEYLANLTRCSTRELSRRLKTLKDCGYIHIETKKNGMIWERKIFSNLNYERTNRSARTDTAVCFEQNRRSEYYDNSYKDKKEQQQEPSAVAAVFPDCLKDLDIPPSEKAWILQKYELPQIEKAVAYVKAPGTKISTTLVQCLKWALKTQPEAPKCVSDVSSENKAYAKKCESMKSPKAQILALNTYVELFFNACEAIPLCIKYTENAFKEKLDDGLRKYGFA